MPPLPHHSSRFSFSFQIDIFPFLPSSFIIYDTFSRLLLFLFLPLHFLSDACPCPSPSFLPVRTTTMVSSYMPQCMPHSSNTMKVEVGTNAQTMPTHTHTHTHLDMS